MISKNKYDNFGRVKATYAAGDGTTCYTYGNTLGYEYGQLLSLYKMAGDRFDSSCVVNGSVGSVNPTLYAESYEYYSNSNLFQVQSKTVSIYENGVAKQYTQNYEYETGQLARLEKITLPEMTNGEHAVQKFEYDKQSRIKGSALLVNGQKFEYDAPTFDKFNNVTQYKFANTQVNYTFDDITGLKKSASALNLHTQKAWKFTQNYKFNQRGYLTERKLTDNYTDDAVDESQIETFGYTDVLGNRLNSVTINGEVQESISYDALGNIRTRSFYGENMVYSYAHSQPHAVSSIAYSGERSAAAGGASNFTNKSFLYDSAGNMSSESRTVGGDTHLHTTFDVSKNNQVLRMFGEDGDRAYLYANGAYYRSFDATKNTRTTYIDNIQHIEDDNGDHYIYQLGFGEVTVDISQNEAGEQQTIANVVTQLHDHLGSVFAIGDVWGNYKEYYHFSAFGEKLAGKANPSNDVYTGHEYIEDFGLIHMQGRVYNPTIARFIQADPIIQYPTNLQTYNAYTYVMNNPLSFTDPTGFEANALYGAADDYIDDNGGTCEAAYGISCSVMVVGIDTLSLYGGEVQNAGMLSVGYTPDEIGMYWQEKGIDISADPTYTLRKMAGLSEHVDMPVGLDVLLSLPIIGGVRGLGELYAGRGMDGEDISRKEAVAWVIAGALGLRLLKPINKHGGKAMKEAFNKGKKGCGCFIAGTQVKTENGYKNIEGIKVGDKVWSRDENGVDEDWKEVTDTFIFENREIFELTLVSVNDGLINEVLETTADHPYWAENKSEWLSTTELEVGDLLVDDDNAQWYVQSVILTDRITTTYNFTVADYHTYYVTEHDIWVHNLTPCEQLALNRKNGVEFENAVVDAFSHVGSSKNNKVYSVTLSNGRVVNTIPDMWGKSVGGIVEIKNVKNLSFTRQLRAQADLALRNGTPYNIVVSPRNNKISSPLWKAVRSTGGSIFEYNPASGALTELTK